MKHKSNIIEIKLTFEEYEKFEMIAEQKSMEIESITKIGLFLYMKRLEGRKK